MLRKKVNYSFRHEVEWLEKPDSDGLLVPYHRPFCPSLSKSAPCNCCAPVQQQDNCTDCTTALPVPPAHLYIDDSVYGANLIDINVTTSVNVTSQGYNSDTECLNNAGIHSISVPAQYILSCHLTGSTYYLQMLVSYRVCVNNVALRSGAAGTFNVNQVLSNHVNLPRDCSLASGGIAFTMPVQGNFPSTSNQKYYPTGATLTLHA